MIQRILISPKRFTREFNLEVECTRKGTVLFLVKNSADRLIAVFLWGLLKGGNVAKIDKIVASTPGRCRIEAINEMGNLMHVIEAEQFIEPPSEVSKR